MTAAIVVGAGRGRRLGGPVPKQYRLLAGEPILRHTLRVFLNHPAIRVVQAVIHRDDLPLYEQATSGLSLPAPVFGGETRAQSVRFGLERLSPVAPAKVLIHDAVRPFIDHASIDAIIAALDEDPAALVGVPVPDTLKRCVDGLVTATVDRTGIWRAQTPQGFRYDDILAAHRRLEAAGPDASDSITDDSLVAEQAGLRVRIVRGPEDNFKITTEHDLLRAEALMGPGA